MRVLLKPEFWRYKNIQKYVEIENVQFNFSESVKFKNEKLFDSTPNVLNSLYKKYWFCQLVGTLSVLCMFKELWVFYAELCVIDIPLNLNIHLLNVTSDLIINYLNHSYWSYFLIYVDFQIFKINGHKSIFLNNKRNYNRLFDLKYLYTHKHLWNFRSK